MFWEKNTIFNTFFIPFIKLAFKILKSLKEIL